MKNIISLSGGKDSTAMLLMMLEKNEPIHSAVFFDTGWEFPEMGEHIDKLEKYTGLKFVRLKPKINFDYLLNTKPTIPVRGKNKSGPARAGIGWPSIFMRWCTRAKIDSIQKYLKQQNNFTCCIGIAADETKRVPVKSKRKYPERYPLIEWDVSEKEALQYCYDHGFDWGGLYKLFGRVSCFCCPLKRIGDFRILRECRPELWARMLSMDPGNCRPFSSYKTIADLEKRFASEEALPKLFPDLNHSNSKLTKV